MTIPVEEVLAMQFTFAKELAEEQANENVREAVVTVPGWYNEQERRAVLDAAEIAGLRVLGLVNDGSAGSSLLWTVTVIELSPAPDFLLASGIMHQSPSITP